MALNNKTPQLMEMMIMMAQVSRMYKGACDRMASTVGLTQAVAWPAIKISRMGDHVRPGALAESLGIEASSLVRVMDQLFEDGVIERREDANDRRAKTLSLTDKGREKVRLLEEALIPFRQSLLDGLSQEQLDACYHVFTTIGNRLKVDKDV